MYAVGVRVVGLIACITFFVVQTFGQDLSADTTWLSPLEITASFPGSWSPGSHIQSVDSIHIENFKGSSLGALLQNDQGVYLREYGPGMLSSISLRGTAAHHTSLLWNGLPVNYPSLGVADYSVVPVFFIDKAEVFYGGNSALAGSGAIGGAISLEDRLIKGEKSLTIRQEAGSFESWFTGLKVQLAGQKIGGSAAVFHKTSENNYPFLNRAKAGNPVERQEHGAFEARGVKANFFAEPWKNGAFLLNSWLTTFDREIIPPYTVPASNDTQKDQSLRVSVEYKHRMSNRWKADSRIGRIHDRIQFNGLSSASSQYLWSGNIEGNVFSWLQFRAGSLVNHIVADVPEYGTSTSENRADAYVFLNFYPLGKWELSVNSRYGWVQGFAVPFTPSLGSSFTVFSKSGQELKWRTQLSRSYRVPTLNDRYWNPGGDPNLLSEEAWNVESGFDWSCAEGETSWEASATAYAHWVKNWILWLPDGNIWAPANVRNVYSRGAEFAINNKRDLGLFDLSTGLNYALTFAEVQDGYAGDAGNVGNQLPYLPQQQGSWDIRGEIKSWNLSFSGRYYGRRFTLIDNTKALKGYAVTDFSTGREFSFKSSLLSAQFSVRNILNVSYENLEYRPMPGRSFELKLNYTFKPNK